MFVKTLLKCQHKTEKYKKTFINAVTVEVQQRQKSARSII